VKGAPAAGDLCSVAECVLDLVEANAAVVCPKCDAVLDWPSVKRGQAKIVK
jgi:hypothetical protein